MNRTGASIGQSELDRIRTAYRNYSTDPSERKRRDPNNLGLRAIHDEWRKRLGLRLAAAGISIPEARILDVGCGDGRLLAWFVEHGAASQSCVGIDLVPERTRAAEARLPGARFVCTDASTIPAAGDSFDLVCLSMLLSSVLSPELAAQISSECTRVLAPGGAIAWYDSRYPNPANPDVRAVGRRTLRRLFPEFSIELESVSVLPPLSRRLGRATRMLYPALAAVPPLRARYVGLLFPPFAEERS